MGLETTTTIAGLVATNPLDADMISSGDDHLRLIKAVLKATFPGVGGVGYAIPITVFEAQLNKLVPIVDNIAELKAQPKLGQTVVATLGYWSIRDGGHGAYWLDTADTTSVDNGGTIIVATDGGRWKLVDTNHMNLRQWGAKGDGVTDDTVRIQAAIDYFKVTQVLSTAFILNDDVPKVLDMAGGNYMVSASIDFNELYYFKMCNGQFIADSGTVWAGAPVLYIADVQPADPERNLFIRTLIFDNIKVIGNMAANGIYLENSYFVTIQNSTVQGWPTGGTGYGIKTSRSSATPKTKNTHLTLINITASQFELPHESTGDGVAVSIESADFIINGMTLFKAGTCLFIDGFFNGQISNLHAFCKAADYCLVVGPDVNGLTINNFYADTGIVLQKSFSTVYTACIFVASSSIELQAQAAGEKGKGLVFSGCLMPTPTFTTAGGASWDMGNLWVQMLGCIRADGVKTFGQIIRAEGDGKIAIDGNNEVHFFTNSVDVGSFDVSGRLFVGSHNTNHPINSTGANIQQHNTASNANLNMSLWAASAVGPAIGLAKSRTASIGTFGGYPLTSDVLGQFVATGDNGTNFNSGGGRLGFLASENWSATNNGTRARIYCTANAATAQTAVLTAETTVVNPGFDNAATLGSAGTRWKEVFAVSGTINTSDEREKTDISPCMHGLDFINDLNPVSFKWRVGSNIVKSYIKCPATYGDDGNIISEPVVEDVIETIPGVRTHYGLLAQDVKNTADKLGIPDFAGWILTDKDDPNSMQGLRNDQIIPFLVKAIQELSTEITKLKNR